MPDVRVLRPKIIPIHGQSAIYRFNAAMLRRTLKSHGVDPGRATAWVYLPHPVILQILDEFPWQEIVYDMCDDLSDFVAVAPEVLEVEVELGAKADLVVASSRSLEQRAKALAERVVYVPNGADTDRYAGTPPWERKIQRVTYVGSIFEWFDVGLVAAVASARPDLEFVLAGPSRISLASLERMPNVTIIGAIPYQDVPELLAATDVVMIPFRPGPLIEATDPLKAYEALAAGRPILATEMSQLDRFGESVRTAPDAAGWLVALNELASGAWPFSDATARSEVRRTGDWTVRFRELEAALATSQASP